MTVLGLVFSSLASAQGMGLSAGASTLGFGLDLYGGISERMTGRIGFNDFTYNKSISSDNIDYAGSLKWQSLHAIADWYPWAKAFRLSGGLMYNDNKASLNAKPSASATYTVNGHAYSVANVGSLSGEMNFDHFSPYLGIGWGNPVAKDKGFGFVADIGVLYQGTPKVTLNATCSAALLSAPGGAAICTSLKSDTAVESTKLKSDLNKDQYKFYPVISLGVSYRF